MAKKLGLKTKVLSPPVKASALNGTALFTITDVTEPVALTLDNDYELISFYLFHSPARTLILGYPWLVSHNPHIDWPTGKILGWGEDCEGKCLRDETYGQATTIINTVCSSCHSIPVPGSNLRTHLLPPPQGGF